MARRRLWGDPPSEMYKQAKLGDVDFITGDYLAEVNIANNAEEYAQGKHPGYEETAWEGIRQAIDVIAEKKIKVAVNGGALNPQGLARKVAELVNSKGYDMRVAYVSGDDILPRLGRDTMPQGPDESLPHLDAANPHVNLLPEATQFLKNDREPRKIVSANAYLGAHAIYEALRNGADIIICGRVSDASPVIACAWYWWSWTNTDYDQLAAALIAGHTIECSAYVTGGNFAGFEAYNLEAFVEPGFPIAEVARDGSCVITKHAGTGGMVNVDTCRSQLLYELQGHVYLNSDVKAYLNQVVMEQVGADRVHVSGIRGAPPPYTTKLAIFYKGGYEMQFLVNATGYAVDEKFKLFEKQIRSRIGNEGQAVFDSLHFQRIGTPASDPRDQNSSTVYFRIFAQATDLRTLAQVGQAFKDISLRHFSGFHSSLDFRTAVPRPYLAYWPSLWRQADLEERVCFVKANGDVEAQLNVAKPPKYELLEDRESYDTPSPSESALQGESRKVRLGDVALGRSGDKGSNLNFGLFVHRVKTLLGDELRADFAVERVEFPGIFAVHFVVYGILGKGVSSSHRLDGFGKGFIDYIRDKVVEVPASLLNNKNECLGASSLTSTRRRRFSFTFSHSLVHLLALTMVRITNLVLGVIAVASASTSAQYFSRYDQEKQNKDATCDNNCYFRSMSGSCADDPACVCNQNAKRDALWCCLAKNCDSNVLPEAIWRHGMNCDAFKMPIPEEFDVQGVCGIPWASTTSTKAAATPTAESSSVEAGESSAAAATGNGSSATAAVTTTTGAASSADESAATTTAAPAITSPASSGAEASVASDAATTAASPAAGAGPVQPGFGVLAAALGMMFWWW
ncbi:hypothetical protein BN1723_015530 [Verticillium longisporum]|uniref:DUF1446 domain-containing protein n=1 Tax=Verticillium longisporum TaxID=100787 RepID=A0A0G4MZJ2_VERLO|nr:hypothetical protein BN1723_015530 [Verticillium longisporum]